MEDDAAGTTRLGGRTVARRRRQRRGVGGRELRVVRFALRLSRQDERNDLVSEAFDIGRWVQADSSATLCQVQDSLPRRTPSGHEHGEFDRKRNDVAYSSTPPAATNVQADDQRKGPTVVHSPQPQRETSFGGRWTGHSTPIQVSQQRRKHDRRQGLPHARRSGSLLVEESASGPDLAAVRRRL